MTYRFLEHTADLWFEAEGRSLEECFENSARALMDAMVEGRIDQKLERELELEAPSVEELLHDFLSELLFLFETDRLVFSGFELRLKEGTKLEAKLRGEVVDEERHKLKTYVKAVTYHNLKVERLGSLWKASVVCDT